MRVSSIYCAGSNVPGMLAVTRDGVEFMPSAALPAVKIPSDEIYACHSMSRYKRYHTVVDWAKFLENRVMNGNNMMVVFAVCKREKKHRTFAFNIDDGGRVKDVVVAVLECALPGITGRRRSVLVVVKDRSRLMDSVIVPMLSIAQVNTLVLGRVAALMPECDDHPCEIAQKVDLNDFDAAAIFGDDGSFSQFLSGLYLHEHRERAIKLPVIKIPSDNRKLALIATHSLIVGDEQPLDLMLVRYAEQEVDEKETVGLSVTVSTASNRRWLMRLLGRMQNFPAKCWCWMQQRDFNQEIPDVPSWPIRYSFAGETSFRSAAPPNFYHQGPLTSLAFSTTNDGVMRMALASRDGRREEEIDAAVLKSSPHAPTCMDVDGECIYSGTAPFTVCIQVLPNIARLIA